MNCCGDVNMTQSAVAKEINRSRLLLQNVWVTVGDVPFSKKRVKGAAHPPPEEEEDEEEGVSYPPTCAHYGGPSEDNNNNNTKGNNNRTVMIWCERPLRGRLVGLHVRKKETG